MSQTAPADNPTRSADFRMHSTTRSELFPRTTPSLVCKVLEIAHSSNGATEQTLSRNSPDMQPSWAAVGVGAIHDTSALFIVIG